MQYVVLLVGAALLWWGWWATRRAHVAGLRAVDQRRQELEAAAAELAAVAEDVMRDVQQRTDALRELCHQAELLIARLEATAGWPAGRAAVAAPPVARPPGAPGAASLGSGSVRAAPAAGRSVGGAVAEVRRLADQGLAVTEIAKLTGRTRGEVQLILGLKKLDREAGGR